MPPKVGSIQKLLVAVRAGMWAVVSVRFLVSAETAAVAERLAAQVAEVGPLLRVSSLVRMEVRLELERLLADGAPVRHFSCVDLGVFLQPRGACEGLETLGARKGLLSSVHTHVLLQFRRRHERLPAMGAQMSQILGVPPFVILKALGPTKPLFAEDARVGFVSGVDLLVDEESGLALKLLSTLIAFKASQSAIFVVAQQLMYLKTRLLPKAFLADVAGVQLFTRVLSPVRPQLCSESEGLATLCALVRLHARNSCCASTFGRTVLVAPSEVAILVRLHVRSEVTRLRERFSTHAASIRPLACVGPPMKSQQALKGKYLPTVLALVSVSWKPCAG